MINYAKSKNNLLIFLICLLIAIVAAATIESDQIGLGHDDGIYTILGKALQQGQGLRLINLPTAPYQAKYPIVYPYLISLVWHFVDFPGIIFWIKLLNVGFLFFSLIVTYYISLRLLDSGRGVSIIVTSFVGTSAYILYLSINAFSEIPYLFFSLMTVLFFLLAEEKESLEESNKSKYILYFFGILCGSLSFQTRAIGLSLLVSSIIYLILKKRILAAIIAGFFIFSFNFPWLLWSKFYALDGPINPLLHYYTGYSLPGGSGLKSFVDIAALKTITFGNAIYLFENTSKILFALSDLIKPAMGLIWIILIFGIWKSNRRKCHSFIYLYLTVYVLIYLFFPFTPISHLRYLVPVAPFLFIFLLNGVLAGKHKLAGYFRSDRLQFYFTAVILILFLPNLAVSAKLYMSYLQQQRIQWDGYAETISWIKTNTHNDAILACVYDPVYYLYTGRLALRPWAYDLWKPNYSSMTSINSDVDSFKDLKKMRVDYLIQEPLGGVEKKIVKEFFTELLRKHAQELKLVFVSSDQFHKIYQIQYQRGDQS